MSDSRLQLDRRSFLQVTGGALAVAAPFGLTGCGGLFGGGGGGDELSADPVTILLETLAGRVVLPSGLSPDGLRVANVFNLGAPTAGGGNFAAQGSAEPTMTAVFDAQDRVVLMGFLDKTHTQLDARSTAKALAYFMLGASVHLLGVTSAYHAALDEPGVLDNLAAAIDASIAANGAAWMDNPGSVVEAELAAVVAALGPQDGRGAIVEPTERISGVQMTADGIGNATLKHYYRRRIGIFEQRVNYQLTDGQTISDLTPIGEQPIRVASVEGLDGNIVVIIGELGGGKKDFYEPITVGNLPTPLHPATADTKLTNYAFMVVGAGAQAGDFTLCTERQREIQFELSLETLILDLFLPVIANVFLPLNGQAIASWKKYAILAPAIKDLIVSIGETPEIKASLIAGNFPQAAQQTLLLFVNSTTLRNVLIREFVNWVRLSGLGGRNFEQGGIENFASKLAGTLLKATTLLNIATQLTDTILTSSDLMRSQMATLFKVTQTKSKLRVNPPSATSDRIGPAITFTATLVDGIPEEGQLLSYGYSCPSQFGDISDGIHLGPVIDSSSVNTVAYAPNGKAKGGDRESILVTFYDGPINTRRKIGEASATISFNTVVSPSSAYLLKNKDQLFTADVSSALPQGTKFEWSHTGVGSIGGNPVVTTKPSITYNSGVVAGNAGISLRVLAPNGDVLSTGSASITVDEVPRFTYTIEGETFPDAPMQDGSYNDPWEGTLRAYVVARELDTIAPVYDLVEHGDESISVRLCVPHGTRLAPGMTFTGSSQFVAGNFFIHPFNNNAGALTIVSEQDLGGNVYLYHFTTNASSGYSGAVLEGEGRFTVDYSVPPIEV